MNRILLTSGGTKVPIDDVRWITNMSNGTFGSKIAEETLRYFDDAETEFLMAKHSKSPFSLNLDLFKEHHSHYRGLEELYLRMNLLSRCGDRYHQDEYVTFDDYRAKVLEKAPHSDVIILAAAVSDYGVKPAKGKIRSDKDLSILMEPLPKVISEIKSVAPNAFLVGFKLLVGSTKEELIAAAKESIGKNGCDLVVANEWNDLKAGKHKIIIVAKNGEVWESFRHPAAELVFAIERHCPTKLIRT